MRIIIIFLLTIMLILICNIFAYIFSDDYRFFLKKIKYNQEIVYDSIEIDDSEKYKIIETDSISGDVIVWTVEIPEEEIKFLDVLSWKTQQEEEDTLPELFSSEQKILDMFRTKFVLSEVSSIETPLMELSSEYPDLYREYQNNHLSLYMFPTKSYDEVVNIFEVLRYELPFTLNKVNNFASASLYINLMENFSDWKIRILFEYENMVFWLKIKKDSYNSAKEILEALSL